MHYWRKGITDDEGGSQAHNNLQPYIVLNYIIKVVGGGALLPITSFGHSLIHGALAKANSVGIMGIFMGMFDLTATGITAAIIFSFIFTLIFKPKD